MTSASEHEINIDPIKCKCEIHEVDFHPKRDIVGLSLINGTVEIHEYSEEKNKKVYSSQFHKNACRSLQFSTNGEVLFTAGKDGAIVVFDLNKLKPSNRIEKAHIHPINRIKVYSENVLVSGDDEGDVKFWDIRTPATTKSLFDAPLEESDDYISCLYPVPAKDHLIYTCGDGCVGLVDVRKSKMLVMSETVDDALLSIELMKGGTKIVCGSENGVLNMFDYDVKKFGMPSDTYPGHPESIESMVALNPSVLCTGSSDGLVRVVQLYPHNLLGVLGEHGDYPVECVRLSRDHKVVASTSHDMSVRFWDVGGADQLSTPTSDSSSEVSSSASSSSSLSSSSFRSSSSSSSLSSSSSSLSSTSLSSFSSTVSSSSSSSNTSTMGTSSASTSSSSSSAKMDEEMNDIEMEKESDEDDDDDDDDEKPSGKKKQGKTGRGTQSSKSFRHAAQSKKGKAKGKNDFFSGL
eukprot:TRINITY_DN835_c0_g1_i1.p1 TRINITY_DN835_c0_g1~~TRINITY_DN835_c0_g1_i1.p1  ORF type:complete len:463 (+),score=193.47 TRINITY_DN835_c0_g1_i1:67-1455(+)